MPPAPRKGYVLGSAFAREPLRLDDLLDHLVAGAAIAARLARARDVLDTIGPRVDDGLDLFIGHPETDADVHLQ